MSAKCSKKRNQDKVTHFSAEEKLRHIQTVTSKLSARNADFMERVQLSRQRADRLRVVRSRVREMIASDDSLRKVLERVSNWGEDSFYLNSEDGQDFKISLLEDNNARDISKERVLDSMGGSENNDLLCGASGTKDCQVKISRVTKVNKVACLKQYIRQKRMRRASKQASLKKKIESIKNLMEDWHKSLTRVTSRQLSKFPTTSFDEVSQASTGYNTPTYEDFNPGWCPNPFNNYHQYEESEQHGVHKHHRGYNDRGEMPDHQLCDCASDKNGNTLFILPEEESSEHHMEGSKENPDKMYSGSQYQIGTRDYVAV